MRRSAESAALASIILGLGVAAVFVWDTLDSEQPTPASVPPCGAPPPGVPFWPEYNAAGQSWKCQTQTYCPCVEIPPESCQAGAYPCVKTGSNSWCGSADLVYYPESAPRLVSSTDYYADGAIRQVNWHCSDPVPVREQGLLTSSSSRNTGGTCPPADCSAEQQIIANLTRQLEDTRDSLESCTITLAVTEAALADCLDSECPPPVDCPDCPTCPPALECATGAPACVVPASFECEEPPPVVICPDPPTCPAEPGCEDGCDPPPPECPSPPDCALSACSAEPECQPEPECPSPPDCALPICADAPECQPEPPADAPYWADSDFDGAACTDADLELCGRSNGVTCETTQRATLSFCRCDYWGQDGSPPDPEGVPVTWTPEPGGERQTDLFPRAPAAGEKIFVVDRDEFTARCAEWR